MNRISCVALKQEMPVHNYSVTLNVHLRCSGYVLFGQQTSVKCHRCTDVTAELNYLQMLSMLLLLVIITFLVMTII